MTKYNADDEEIIENDEDTGITDDHEFDIPNDSQRVKDDDTVVGSGASIMVPSSKPMAPDTTFTSSILFNTSGRSCNNCKGNAKRHPQHCRIVNGVFQDTCSNRHCSCRCTTHALDKDGQLRKIKFIQGVIP